MVFTHELCSEMAMLSRRCGIQIGVLVNRSGGIDYVIAGSSTGVCLPEMSRRRTHPGRLVGLRLIHTHLKGECLSSEDLTDLEKLRLDMIYAIMVNPDGSPGRAYGAHLLPQGRWKTFDGVRTFSCDIVFDTFIRELEGRIATDHRALDVESSRDRAILVSVVRVRGEDAEMNLDEFRELARSADIDILDVVVQRRPRPDPRFVAGKGKISSIAMMALEMDANLLVFNQELSVSQSRSISGIVDMRVIDRTQLIMDIFARRARTKEGKIQVELAQLRYNMSRLVGSNPSLSRLAGGIGTRGPGEAKLEIDRRRAQERIARLEKEIKQVRKKRGLTRHKRGINNVPVISVVGYTNSGKSSLLNALTKSHVTTADMPFATLDPSSKRMRFPRDVNVVITDTVGFIRELPADLKSAFMATLEELDDADLLLEVIDLSDAYMEQRIKAVEDILVTLGLQAKPRIRVFNKMDQCDPEIADAMAMRYKGVNICALDPSTLSPLIDMMQGFF
ncbi:MAG: GTPase HflX [Thermodesulfobacteriota bacterium]|nr:GTPase HflX [Thermodesulfobacteriota bacterium]